MKRKRIVLAILLAALICTMLTVSAFAEEKSTPLSGKIGDNAYYSYDIDTGVVTISGTGSTKDYMPTGDAPESDYETKKSYHSPLLELEKEGHPISALIIEDGITCLNDELLVYSHCKYIEIAASVKRVELSAIAACNELEAVFFYGDAPDSKLYFDQCFNLKAIYRLPEAQGWDDFDYTVTRVVNGEWYDVIGEIETFCGVPLTDVPGTKYYAKRVAWAYENGIINGYDDLTFRPMDICTRAQVVTFLWRANGSPEPQGTAQSFNDVTEDSYYYKALLWAAEQGIVSGFEDGSFRPYEPVTRAQAVTFIWRMEGCPRETAWCPFNDLQPNEDYQGAIKWADANGIAKGYNHNTFGPMDGCTRAQIVTFLYRDMAE